MFFLFFLGFWNAKQNSSTFLAKAQESPNKNRASEKVIVLKAKLFSKEARRRSFGKDQSNSLNSQMFSKVSFVSVYSHFMSFWFNPSQKALKTFF